MAFDDLNLVTIEGQAVTLDGLPAEGRVTFATSTLVTDALTGQAIFPVPLTVTLDDAGSFSIDVPATNDPDVTPVGWVYQVTVDITGSIRDQFQLAVPYDTVGTVNLFLAAPVTGSGVVYVPQPALNDYWGFAMMMGAL